MEKLEDLPEEVQEVLRIALLTEIEEDILYLLNAFFDAKPEYDRVEAFKVLESYGTRFVGLNAFAVKEFDVRDISGYRLYLTQPLAKQCIDNCLKLKVVAFRGDYNG